MDYKTQLPKVVKKVTQEQVNLYASASGDHNPIHVNPQFAASTTFGRTVAHGMLVLAFLSEMMTQAFGPAWLTSGKLKVRFKAPVFPEDQVSTFGEARGKARLAGATGFKYAVGCHNQGGEEIISGEATVTIPDTI